MSSLLMRTSYGEACGVGQNKYRTLSFVRTAGAVPRCWSWLLSALLLMAISGAALAQDVTPSERVVRNVVVRAEPSVRAVSLGRLVPGDRATLLSADDPGWYQVRLSDGVIGYVSKAWTVLHDNLISGAGYKVHVIDVGTGLAVFAEGKDFALLYDGGSQDDLADGADNRILAYLAKVRPDLKRIDHLILSHPHKDHLELLPDIFDRYEIANVWESGRVNKTNGYCRFLQKIAAEPGLSYHDAIAANAPRVVMFSGSACKGEVVINSGAMMDAASIPLGEGASMSFLYRDARAYADPNGNSVVTRLDLGRRHILLAGDAEGGARKAPGNAPDDDSIEGRLLACCRAALKADALVVGHHGSLTSSRAAFIDAVGARIYAISSGPFPYKSVRLPDAAIVEALAARGTVLRTDLDDEQCASAMAKIGPDNDESPGGCSNILLTIAADGSLSAAYAMLAD